MTIEIFRRRVQHQIRAERDWLLPYGGQKRVVHEQKCAAWMRLRGQSLRMSTIRSSGLLGVSTHTSFGPFARAVVYSGLIRLIDELDAQRSAFRERSQQPIRTAIAVVWSYEQIIGIQQLRDERDCSKS